MPQRSERKGWPGPEYHVEVTLPVPLPFAFAWCTDFRPDDAEREGESYLRKVVERGARRVVFEDAEETPQGWDWARYEVTLQPPNRWHMHRIGNHVDAVGDYRLTALPGNRTRFELTWRRRPGLFDFHRGSKRERERLTTIAWRRFGRAMGRDYKKSRAKSKR